MSGVALRVHEHGTAGRPRVIVLHGGPGGAGEATPLAEGLGRWFSVLEPWQRGSGSERLTVARHVADLHEVVIGCGEPRPALVGHSWGAMLALSYAATHPEAAGPLVLVGCGTYDEASRAQIGRTLGDRVDADVEAAFDDLMSVADPARRAQRRHGLIERLYAFEPDDTLPRPTIEIDERAQDETWSDVVRLQAERIEPQRFSAITGPVLMVHGAHDPHPGVMIRDTLRAVMPQLEYRELARCGHTPWIERHARDEFFTVVREWLARHETTGVKRADGDA